MAEKRIVEFPLAARAKPAGRRLIPDRLRDARKAMRMSQTDLGEMIGVSRQSISAYEKGEKAPEPATFARIADALRQPVVFFTQEDRALYGEFSPHFYRKVGPETERRNQACGVFGKWFVQVAHYLNDYVNFPKVNLPSFEPAHPSGRYTEEEIEVAAETCRAQWGLGLGPISNMVGLLENKGVATCRYNIDGERVDAFSFWNGDRPFVFMASENESGSRVRFDVAHELGHLVLHRWIERDEIADPPTLKKIEAEADRFAGAFLLPRKSFPNEVYSSRIDAFLDLKLRWKVSIQGMIYRCKNLEIIDDDQFTNLYKTMSLRRWRTKEPLDDPEKIPIEQPRMLERAAQILLTDGGKHPDEINAAIGLAPAWIEAFCNLPRRSLGPDLTGAPT